MKKHLSFLILLGLLLGSCNEVYKGKKSIRGRWYFIENNEYKEIHASDSMLCLFDWLNYDHRVFFDNYYTVNDTLWSKNPSADQYIIIPKPFFWGKIVVFTPDSIVLNKNSTKLVLHKMDMNDSLFRYELPKVYQGRKVDSVKYKRWAEYQAGYYYRLMDYLKNHPNPVSTSD